MTTPLWLSRSLSPFLYSSFVYSSQIFLISLVSVRSLPFLSIIMSILAWNLTLITLIFLKRSLVLHILLFSSISLHCSFKKTFLSLLSVLWKSAFSYLSLSPLTFTSLLSSAICKASSEHHFVFLHLFFSFRMVLVIASCSVLQTSVYNSSDTLSTTPSSLNLFFTSTNNHKMFDLGHTWMA